MAHRDLILASTYTSPQGWVIVAECLREAYLGREPVTVATESNMMGMKMDKAGPKPSEGAELQPS